MTLSAHHYTMLHTASAITDEVIKARGYVSIDDPRDVQERGFSKAQSRTAPVLAVPLWNVHGHQSGWQIRPDSPRQMKDGKVAKYETPRGGRLQLDVHPSVQPLLGDPQIPLWLTEGVKKGDALVSHGACAIALTGGVWGFRGTNEHGGKVILPDWEYVALNGRLVYVAYDSDLATKQGVQAALAALWRFLRDRQAIPARVHWPEEYQQRKWGVDDFLADKKSLDDLRALIPPIGQLAAKAPAHQANGTLPAQDAEALPYSDYTNALAFVREHGPNLHYCFLWGKWLVWSGRHWGIDNTGEVVRLAKTSVKRLARRVETLDDPSAISALLKHIKASLATSKLKALAECAQSELPLPVLPEDLDRDPWLLNATNGTVDLRTGTLQPHRREDLLTRCIPVAYDPDALCPIWDSFLERIMAGNANLISFLQRAVGYALTGVIREHVLLILWGSGRNGKSTFLNTLRTMLGPYAIKAPSELLMVSNSDRHPTERADLVGKRLVAAIETEQGRRLAEVFVKEATGGDPIRARRMREDFFEFQPTHKVFLATNHKPVIRGTDNAIWERMKLVKFGITIPEAERDTTLPDKLQAELPGILAWAARGCQTWQHHGLGEPDEVTQATAGYRAEMDVLGQFIEDCCLTGANYRVKASELYEAYQRWCEQNGEYAAYQRPWGMALTERGFESGKVQGRNWWKGIALTPIGQTEQVDEVDEGRPKNGIKLKENLPRENYAVSSSTSSTSSTGTMCTEKFDEGVV